MKTNRCDSLVQKKNSLAVLVLFMSLLILSATAVGAENGTHYLSGGNIGGGVLIVVTASVFLAGLVIMGLVSWGRKQDYRSDYFSDED